MPLVQAFEDVSSFLDDVNTLDKLKAILDPNILEQAFEYAGVATVRRRRLPLEAVMWSVIGMSLFRHETVWDIASRLDISLPGKHKLVAPSALVQGRQRLGYEAVQQTFQLLAHRAFSTHAFEHWCGLNLLAVDGVVFRTQDNEDNRVAFGSDRNQRGEGSYPQIRMCGLMEVSSHLLLDSAFDSRHVGEMTLAERLLPTVPEESLTLFDRGYYSLGLLHNWQHQGQNTHWMIPARKDLQYQVERSLGEYDKIVTLSTSPQARKKFRGLPAHLTARLTSYQVNGKSYRVLSSLTDPLRFPYDELTEVYTQRWEIELGFREMKQGLHQAKHVLRSKKPDMVRQELWGLLLAYNLIRIAMLDAANADEMISPTRLSFSLCMRHVIAFLMLTPIRSASKLPIHYEELLTTLRMFTLPDKLPDRHYPRVVRKKPTKYPYKRKMPVSS
ncbi:IS4 family transposase [Thalassotalea euphylliae]|uniref:IS4 family transposase n=1 Tax=Thalassotalea euphylliae TaxID=1655234 RepID=A0A3E0UES1_9GAMM|nr:IS4 family transposase [Thalassotalea euphylliae]REL35194.1 IS4 family transposase [Thalassotalea euphylliae]REL35727.1 IS4 family transposase [Thalassotalea euphylliae]